MFAADMHFSVLQMAINRLTNALFSRPIRHCLMSLYKKQQNVQTVGDGACCQYDDKFERKIKLERWNNENENKKNCAEHKKIAETQQHYEAWKKCKNCLRKNVGRQTFKKLCIFRSQQVDFLHILHTWQILQYAHNSNQWNSLRPILNWVCN